MKFITDTSPIIQRLPPIADPDTFKDSLENLQQMKNEGKEDSIGYVLLNFEVMVYMKFLKKLRTNGWGFNK